MDRRDFLAGAAVLGAGLAFSTSARAGSPAVPNKHALPASTHAAVLALQQAASACERACQDCIQHCSEELANGNQEMANCNFAVHPMSALCRATADLAAMKSIRLKELLPATIAASKACEDACREHEAHWSHGMHLACKACAEGCDALAKASEAALEIV